MTGENVFKENATNYLDKVVRPTVERGIPFASAHGNHDNAVNITHEIEIDYESKKYDLSYTRSDAGLKPYGGGNYWVPVYATTPPKWFWYNTKPALLLWFLDSRSFVSGHGAGPGPVPAEADYYWVDENTVPRYIASQAELMKQEWGSIPPSLVFVHIPFQKALDLYFLPTEGNHDDEPDPGVKVTNMAQSIRRQ
ncbi:hypothetical protein BT69DRAFT_1283055 [Atractiella rhizophila]|nr:hypothetical protein BT69DRAFT_1283055 [Atractiella rhizophila]